MLKSSKPFQILPIILPSFIMLHSSSCLTTSVFRKILTNFLFNLYYLGFFSRFLILLCHRHVLYPVYPKGQKCVSALFQIQKRNSYQALPVSLSQYLWFIEGKNRVETECACLKGTQPTFGKSSDNISCKCLLYKLFNIFHSWQQSDCHSQKHPTRCFCAFSFQFSSVALLAVWCSVLF